MKDADMAQVRHRRLLVQMPRTHQPERRRQARVVNTDPHSRIDATFKPTNCRRDRYPASLQMMTVF
jgi:hypothetical protein